MSSTNNHHHQLHTYDNVSGSYKYKSDKQSRSKSSSKSKAYNAFTNSNNKTNIQTKSSSDSEQDQINANCGSQMKSGLMQKNLQKKGLNKFTTQQFKIERDNQKMIALRYGNNQIEHNQNYHAISRDGGTSHHSRKPSTNNKNNSNSLHVKKNYPVAPNASYLHSGSNNSPRHKKNLSNTSMFTSYHQNTLQIAASRNNRPLEKGSTLDNTSQVEEKGQHNLGDEQVLKSILRKSDGLSSMKKQIGTYMYGRPQSSRPNRNLKKPLLSVTGENTQESWQAPPTASGSYNYARLKKNSSRVITNQYSPDKKIQPQMEVQGTLLEKREDSPAQKMMSYDLEEDKGRLPNTVADS